MTGDLSTLLTLGTNRGRYGLVAGEGGHQTGKQICLSNKLKHKRSSSWNDFVYKQIALSDQPAPNTSWIHGDVVEQPLRGGRYKARVSLWGKLFCFQNYKTVPRSSRCYFTHRTIVIKRWQQVLSGKIWSSARRVRTILMNFESKIFYLELPILAYSRFIRKVCFQSMLRLWRKDPTKGNFEKKNKKLHQEPNTNTNSAWSHVEGNPQSCLLIFLRSFFHSYFACHSVLIHLMWRGKGTLRGVTL